MGPDEDLDGGGEGVQVAAEPGDQRLLLGRASQREIHRGRHRHHREPVTTQVEDTHIRGAGRLTASAGSRNGAGAMRSPR